jgi:hypothetical protein
MLRRFTMVALTVIVVQSAPAWGQDDASSFTTELGRAAIEFKNDAIQFVAAYYYSQENHDSRWLLIEAAVSTEERITIHRDAFRLITPDGIEIPLAPHARFRGDVERVRGLVQNASTTRHSIGSYFRRWRQEPFRFFRLPGTGTIQDDFVVDRDRTVLGDLFFASPTDAWANGIYTLVVELEGVRAAVPIELD